MWKSVQNRHYVENNDSTGTLYVHVVLNSAIFPQMLSEQYVMHCHNVELQSALVSKPSMLLSWKVVNNINIDPLMPIEDKKFSSSLILEFRIPRRHVQAKNYGRREMKVVNQTYLTINRISTVLLVPIYFFSFVL